MVDGSGKHCSTYHKVSFHELHFVLKTGIMGELSRTLDLVSIVVQPNNVAICKGSDLARWPTNTAADVQYFHSRFKIQDRGEVVFMTSLGMDEGLAGLEATEVERLSPASLEKIGDEVIIAMEQ